MGYQVIPAELEQSSELMPQLPRYARSGQQEPHMSDDEQNPPPPSKLSREKLDELIVSHREHGKRLAWSFLNAWRVRMNHDEIMSVVGMALCEAASRFDAEKGVAFKTFFFYHLRGMLLREIGRAVNEQKVLQYVAPASISEVSTAEKIFLPREWLNFAETNNPEKILEKTRISQACWTACNQLDPLEREVIIRYFVNDEPLVNIAEDLNYCRCHISRVKSRALVRLARLLRNEDEQAMDDEQIIAMSKQADRQSKTASASYTGGRGRRKIRPGARKGAALSKFR